MTYFEGQLNLDLVFQSLVQIKSWFQGEHFKNVRTTNAQVWMKYKTEDFEKRLWSTFFVCDGSLNPTKK